MALRTRFKFRIFLWIFRSSLMACHNYLLGILVLWGLTGCTGSPSSQTNTTDIGEPTQTASVILLLNWFPEAEHGGFYAAQVHDYFADEGLRVEIRPGGPNVPGVQQLDTGRVQFAVMNADRVLFGRNAHADVVAIMAAMQNSPRCVMVHRESGITRLEDLQDVTLAVGSGPAFYKYMAIKLSLSNVETVAYPGSIGLFLANERFAQQAYVFSEPFLAKQKGANPVSLMVSDIGYNPYGSLLVTQGSTIRQNPQLVSKMTRAVVRGWQKYLEDPHSTNKHINQLNPDMNLEALAYGAQEIAKLCQLESDPTRSIGWMTSERWTELIDQLVEIGLVEPDRIDASEMFTVDFLSLVEDDVLE